MGQCISGQSKQASDHAHEAGCKSASKECPRVEAKQIISATGGAGDRDRSINRSVREGLSSLYQVQGELGSGCQGKTWLCQDLTSGEHWAVKMVKLPLPHYLVKGMLREIRIQADLGEGHLNLITPEEVVLTSHYLGLVMEFAPGRSMTQYVSRKWKETQGVGLLMLEEEALYFFKQLVSAVTYIHKNQVVHRDLKLDNTLLSEDDPPYIKLCDFGFARGWGADANFDTIVGTADYMAPQLISAKMGKSEPAYDGVKADVWAMAVTLCVMLMGKFPFESETGFQDAVGMVYSTQRSYKMWRDNPELRGSVELLSPECISLLDIMLEKDERKRADLTTISAHPWMSRPLPPTYQNALDKLGKQQAAVDQKVNNGKLKRHREREKAISALVNTAASDDFRAQATSPISPDFTFRLFNRINLRDPQEHYPVFDRSSVLCMLAKEEGRRSQVQGDMLLSARPGLAGINWGGSVTSHGSHVQASFLASHASINPSPCPSQAQVFLPSALPHPLPHASPNQPMAPNPTTAWISAAAAVSGSLPHAHGVGMGSSSASPAAQHHLYSIAPGNSVNSQHGFGLAGAALLSSGGTPVSLGQHPLYNIAGSLYAHSPTLHSHSPLGSHGVLCGGLAHDPLHHTPSEHNSQGNLPCHNMAGSSFRSTMSAASGLYGGHFAPIQPGQLGPQMLCPGSLGNSAGDPLFGYLARAGPSSAMQPGSCVPTRMGAGPLPGSSPLSRPPQQHTHASTRTPHDPLRGSGSFAPHGSDARAFERASLPSGAHHDGAPADALSAVSVSEGNAQQGAGRRSFPGGAVCGAVRAHHPAPETPAAGESIFDCDINAQCHLTPCGGHPLDEQGLCAGMHCMNPRLDMVPEEANSSCRPSANISPMPSNDGSHLYDCRKHSQTEDGVSWLQSCASSPMLQTRALSGHQWLGLQPLVTTPYGSATSIAAAAGGHPSSPGNLPLSHHAGFDKDSAGLPTCCPSPSLPSQQAPALLRFGSGGSGGSGCQGMSLGVMVTMAGALQPRDGGDSLNHGHLGCGGGQPQRSPMSAKSRSSDNLATHSMSSKGGLKASSGSMCGTHTSSQRTSSGNSTSWALGGGGSSTSSSMRQSSGVGTDPSSLPAFSSPSSEAKRGAEAAITADPDSRCPTGLTQASIAQRDTC
ncbi:MAG: hypothetical protein WDW36_003178 [Sanguina aurantia]